MFLFCFWLIISKDDKINAEDIYLRLTYLKQGIFVCSAAPIGISV